MIKDCLYFFYRSEFLFFLQNVFLLFRIWKQYYRNNSGFPNFQLIIWATVTTFTEPLRHFIRSLAISRTFSSASGHLADLCLIHYLYKQLRLNNFLRPIFQVKSCSLLTNFLSSGADQRLLTWEELRPVILCSLSSRSRMDSIDCDRTPVKNQNYQ